MDFCRKFMSRTRKGNQTDHDLSHKEKEDHMHYEDDIKNNIDLGAEAGEKDENPTSPQDEHPASPQDEDNPVFYHTTEFENAQNDSEANTENTGVDDVPVTQEDVDALADSAIDYLRTGFRAAAVYNHIVTEYVPVAPSVPHEVIRRLDRLIPLCESATDSHELHMNILGLPADANLHNPFETFKRKVYALKYLLEDN